MKRRGVGDFKLTFSAGGVHQFPRQFVGRGGRLVRHGCGPEENLDTGVERKLQHVHRGRIARRRFHDVQIKETFPVSGKRLFGVGDANIGGAVRFNPHDGRRQHERHTDVGGQRIFLAVVNPVLRKYGRAAVVADDHDGIARVGLDDQARALQYQCGLGGNHPGAQDQGER
ncbi:hypothetical protein D3C71_1570650 [compost metagenome]